MANLRKSAHLWAAGEVTRLGIGHIMKYLQRKGNAHKPENQRLDLSQVLTSIGLWRRS
jgi:hypothetical protein